MNQKILILLAFALSAVVLTVLLTGETSNLRKHRQAAHHAQAEQNEDFLLHQQLTAALAAHNHTYQDVALHGGAEEYLDHVTLLNLAAKHNVSLANVPYGVDLEDYIYQQQLAQFANQSGFNPAQAQFIDLEEQYELQQEANLANLTQQALNNNNLTEFVRLGGDYEDFLQYQQTRAILGNQHHQVNQTLLNLLGGDLEDYLLWQQLHSQHAAAGAAAGAAAPAAGAAAPAADAGAAAGAAPAKRRGNRHH
jgi:hypothetical protein